MKKKYPKGFTLIEVIVVIAILVIIMSTVFSLINPSEQLKKSLDAGRQANAHELLSALAQYSVDKGYLPWNANPPISGCNPIQTANQSSLSITGTSVSSASSCIQAMIDAGYLNRQFMDNSDITNSLLISQESDTLKTVVCLRPDSQSLRTNSFTIYSGTGYKQSSGCEAQGGSNACYWCIR